MSNYAGFHRAPAHVGRGTHTSGYRDNESWGDYVDAASAILKLHDNYASADYAIDNLLWETELLDSSDDSTLEMMELQDELNSKPRL
jgi:hypothetical protein